MCLMLLYTCQAVTCAIYTVFCGTGGCRLHTKRIMNTSFHQAAHGRLLAQAVPSTRCWGPHNKLSVPHWPAQAEDTTVPPALARRLLLRNSRCSDDRRGVPDGL